MSEEIFCFKCQKIIIVIMQGKDKVGVYFGRLNLKTKKLINLPGSARHIILSTEYDQHIGPTVIENPCPILYHPHSSFLVYELIFKIEYIRIVWCHFDIHFLCRKIKHYSGWIIENYSLFYATLPQIVVLFFNRFK